MLLDLMKDAEKLAEMSFGDKMLGSLTVSLLGMVTCFVVLAILMFSIRMIGGQKEKETPAIEAPAKPAPAIVQADKSQEIAAVITAAIGAYMQGNTAFRIVNISPVRTESEWAQEGRARAFAGRGSQIR